MKPSVRSIFETLCELPPEKRDEKLHRLCGKNDSLRREVQTLLDEMDSSSDFMLEPTIDSSIKPESPSDVSDTRLSPDPDSAEITEGPGSVIGRFKLLEQIGTGGFGVVYMAQQSEPVRRRVALKIIKLGMDTKQVIARFDAERQALAMMDHPNIASVLDGGSTASGRPYFVMELVRGEPITAYCDRNRLSLRERLTIFQQVCHAVQHAHQKGIIHRDIKPSNVLVTVIDDKPMVKVIDFGIAKATHCELTQKTLFTEFRQLVGTPQYMSPEQASHDGADVDTRTDVYSLGVLLFEILTGRTPIDPTALRRAGWIEMQRMIIQEEPSRPSALVTSMSTNSDSSLIADLAGKRATQSSRLGSLLRGDLDWIVLKTLEKDRTRRYGTASELESDIARYLANETVEATPPSKRYRLQKFVQRNRAALMSLSVIALALIFGLVASSVSAVRARRAERAAVSAYELAKQNEQMALEQKSRATRAALVAGGSLLIPSEEATALAKDWQRDLDRDSSDESLTEKLSFAAWYGGWLLTQNRFDESLETIEKYFSEAKSRQVNSPTFMSLANTRVLALSRSGAPAQAIASAYMDLANAMEALYDRATALELYPEVAAAMAAAGKEETAKQLIQLFLEERRRNPEPTSPELNLRLDIALDGLAAWSKTNPDLFGQLKSIRETGITTDDDSDLKADLAKLQGEWIFQRRRNGQVVEQMSLQIEGNRSVTTFSGPDGKTVGGRQGQISLSRSGGVKVLKASLGGAAGRSVAFIYDVDEDKLITVSGMLANENSLPEKEMIHWQRQ